MTQETQRQSNNPFAVTKQQETAQVEALVSRQAQEVQAAMVVAKRFPRNEEAAMDRILRSCQRPRLAEQALYAYPKGGTKVEGPSIRLAECIAQGWQNVDFGIVELEQRNGESSVMAYAWDLETNVRQTKIFQVPHQRKSHGQIKSISDPREVYELIANQGARRLRACILGIIPGDVVDAAEDEVNKTLRNAVGRGKPLEQRIHEMVDAFGEIGVTKGMLEARLQHNIEATTEADLVSLRKVFASLRDGMSKVSDWFQPEPMFGPPKTPQFEDDGPSQPAKENAPEVPQKRKRGRPKKETAAEEKPADDDVPMDFPPPEEDPNPTLTEPCTELIQDNDGCWIRNPDYQGEVTP